MSGRVRRGSLAGLCGLLAGCTVPIETGPATVGSIEPERRPVPVVAPAAPKVAQVQPRIVRAAEPVVARPARPTLCDIGRSGENNAVLVSPAPCAVELRPTLQP